jgi:ubiquinone/menaquinone biosynthesis C-methylase UbiE
MENTSLSAVTRKPLTLKRRIELTFRKIGLDPLIYYYVSVKDRRKFAADNRTFQAANPGLKLPPARLRFDVIACSHAEYYVTTGKAMAIQMHEVMKKWSVPKSAVICEWGCGPGRILFPLAAMDTRMESKFIGTDMYPPSIKWAQSVQDGHTTFHLNKMTPPLAIPANSVDFVYAVSVFTHLSEPLTKDWLGEIMRILKPGGIFWFSAHNGQHHRHELNPAQQAALNRGEFVAIDSKHDGSQMYTGIHCPELMKTLIAAAGAELLEYQVNGNNKYQDAWIVRKC